MGQLLLPVACAGEAARSLDSADVGVDPGSSGSSTVAVDAGRGSEVDAPAGVDTDVRDVGLDPVTTATSDAGTACSSLPLCDGFEEDTPGAKPVGWNVVMGCNASQVSDGPAAEGGLIVGVDSSQHHSGSNSLRIVDGDSCGYYAVNTSAFANSKLGPQLYARYWAMYSMGPTSGHNGFMAMTTTGGDHYRLGFQDDVIAWNAEKSDSTLPDMDPQGTMLSAVPSANTWVCIEFHIDETNGHIEFWFNASPQPTAGLSFDGTSTQGVTDQWARGGPTPAVAIDFGLGWLHLNDSMTVWFDDVALGNSRIGCN
jgi:polysaccharide lyase-like protein